MRLDEWVIIAVLNDWKQGTVDVVDFRIRYSIDYDWSSIPIWSVGQSNTISEVLD